LPLDDSKYEALYNKLKGRYMKDPSGSIHVVEIETGPTRGERVPEFGPAACRRSALFSWNRMRPRLPPMRMELGIKYNWKSCSITSCLKDNAYSYQGDIQVHPPASRDRKRVEPPTTGLQHGPTASDQKNYGEWANKE